MQDMMRKAELTVSQLKLITNPCRLMVLCSLVEGRKNVSELMNIVGVSQTLMSNHLSVLKKGGIVDFERNHRNVEYFITDNRMLHVLTALHDVYCQED